MLDRELLLPNLVRRYAHEEPGRPFLTEVTGRTAGYGDLYRLALRWIAGFRSIGVEPGDRVLTMTPPRIDWMAAWMGLAMMKAVDAGVSTDFHGEMLRYVITKADAEVLVTLPDYVHRITDDVVRDSRLRTVVVTGASEPAPAAGVTTVWLDELLGDAEDPDRLEPVEAWDTAAMVLTSGTTGPSKYVVNPWGLHYTGGLMVPGVTPDDIWYQPLPAYHNAARFGIHSMALVGGQLVFRDRFSVSEFWTDVRKHRCTTTNITPIARLLLIADPHPEERDNTLRTVILSPLTLGRRFADRFDVQVCSAFGTTEVGVPIVAGFNAVDAVPMSCGQPIAGDYPGVEVRIADDHDNAMPPGDTGELLIRTREPWALLKDYFGDPEATANVWRNGWYHTGDAFRQDDDGNLFFVDRTKDTLRRRGENISSFEVEALVNGHPEVAESAAVGVPAEGEEDELLIILVPRERVGFPPMDRFYEDLVARLPRSMLPRYIRLVEELPKTEATSRIQKARLRADGVTEDTWDRESVMARTRR